jgi:hypothetical protein
LPGQTLASSSPSLKVAPSASSSPSSSLSSSQLLITRVGSWMLAPGAPGFGHWDFGRWTMTGYHSARRTGAPDECVRIATKEWMAAQSWAAVPLSLQMDRICSESRPQFTQWKLGKSSFCSFLAQGILV